eukprot:Skav226654  [mRNA]  locus=scaffold2733:41787:43220:- [translate_table: standard]
MGMHLHFPAPSLLKFAMSQAFAPSQTMMRLPLTFASNSRQAEASHFMRRSLPAETVRSNLKHASSPQWRFDTDADASKLIVALAQSLVPSHLTHCSPASKSKVAIEQPPLQ